jgi:hypothetical protein
MEPPSSDPIEQIRTMAFLPMAVSSALELKVFTVLGEGPRTVQQIATKIGVKPRPPAWRPPSRALRGNVAQAEELRHRRGADADPRVGACSKGSQRLRLRKEAARFIEEKSCKPAFEPFRLKEDAADEKR